jgi:hypothetical protein
MYEPNVTNVNSPSFQSSMSSDVSCELVPGGASLEQEETNGYDVERESTIMYEVGVVLLVDLKRLIICLPQMTSILHTTGPVNLFRFIINPNHFGQSVENLYYMSCLFHEGICGFKITEDGEPITCESMSLWKVTLLRNVRLM